MTPLETVVRADRSQLEQVLINLAFNARDAMASGGTIRIETETRQLDAEAGQRLIGIPIPEGDYGLISVMDSGHGMDPTTLAQVFEPFFTTKPVGSGTGLGLSTVYGIIKQSGGYVWVDSTPGEGTTLHHLLAGGERAAAPARRSRSREQPEPQARGETVMILEDEDGVRELTARVLRDRGYQVVLARNGARGDGRPPRRRRRARPPADRRDRSGHGDGGAGGRGPQGRRPSSPSSICRAIPGTTFWRGACSGRISPFLQKPFTGEDLASDGGADGAARVNAVVGRPGAGYLLP